MRSPDNTTSAPHLKNDLDRELRGTSPAVKRPASDMGAHDREEHGDVNMQDDNSTPVPTLQLNSADIKAKQQYTDEHHNDPDKMKDVAHASDPGNASHIAPSDSTSDSSDSLLPTPSTRSTAATSVEMDVTPTVTDIPSIDDQIGKVIQLKEKSLFEGQKGYIISLKWLVRVLARSTDTRERYDKSATEGEIGPVDNSDLAMVTEDSGKLKDEAGEKFVQLRPGVDLSNEYEIVPKEAWELILSWYGLAKDSPIITRYAHDVSDPNNFGLPDVKYELDPPVFSLLKIVAEHTTETQRQTDLPPPRLVASKYMKAMDWLVHAKETSKIPMETRVRPWRILSGLKNTHTSGILTPAASRSASPAPGVEIAANAGDRMLLDVNTFAALSQGDQREKLDLDDQTNNQNYNGKSTLALLGMGRSDVIVLEEQKGGPGGGEWPSEHTRLGIGKSHMDRLKGSSASGRASPAPGSGPTTRGRSMREGRAKGLIGLSNLGNTCYMNSALQSLRSVEELTEYFRHGDWKKELNKDNPLGHDGNVASAYAALIQMMYESSNSCSPNKFKAIVGRYASGFSGYQQQDSQEFLIFLLNGLGEDLNRIKKKPYIERPDSTDEMVHNPQALKEFADRNWADYKARNESVITDLFAGLYKSTLTCPVCAKVSIIFDPFTNLTLQLPIENNWSKEVAFVPLYGKPLRMDVEVSKESTIRELKGFVADQMKKDPSLLVVAEDYKNRFYRIFDNNVALSDSNIQTNDVICVYETEDKPTNYNPDKVKHRTFYGGVSNDDDIPNPSDPEADKMLISVFHRHIKNPNSRISARPFFGLPSLIVLSREDNKSYDAILKKILGNVQMITSKSMFDEELDDEEPQEDSDTLVMNNDSSSSGPSTSSEQNEDGYVDVSMRDTQAKPESKHEGTEAKTKAFVASRKPVSDQLRSLFTPCVQKTGEGVVTGWNGLHENTEYTSLLTRLPKQLAHRKKKSVDEDSDGDAEDSSGDDLGDIDHDAAVNSPAADSSEESNSSLPNMEDGDTEASEAHNMAKSRGHTRFHKKAFKRKGKIIQGKTKQQQRQPASQPKSYGPAPTQVPVSTSGLILPGECLILDWTDDGYEALFGGTADEENDMRGAPLWKNVPRFDNPDLEARRRLKAERKKNGVSLEDCLTESKKSEILSEQNAWYCPRCKTHRRAEKKYEVWKCPDILVMHLKRFTSNRDFRNKLDLRVDYPLHDLDMSSMVLDQDQDKSMMYDLIAVDNHYGGLGGGHYTAYARNPNNEKWYEYNGKSMSKRT